MTESKDWVYNYFNYFTEIEEHFRKVRGTGLFLLSPLDWALIECWKTAEIPLAAVLRGIDVAFEKWRSKRSKTQMVNSLTFCAQAVLTEAQVMAATGQPSERKVSAPPFPVEELRAYLSSNAAALRRAGEPYRELAETLDRLAAEAEMHHVDLEPLEQRLTVLEEKMIAAARGRETEEDLLASRQELERHLRPYRGKMSAPQLAMLEKQYLERSLLEKSSLPRLSLFYLR